MDENNNDNAQAPVDANADAAAMPAEGEAAPAEGEATEENAA